MSRKVMIVVAAIVLLILSTASPKWELFKMDPLTFQEITRIGNYKRFAEWAVFYSTATPLQRGRVCWYFLDGKWVPKVLVDSHTEKVTITRRRDGIIKERSVHTHTIYGDQLPCQGQFFEPKQFYVPKPPEPSPEAQAQAAIEQIDETIATDAPQMAAALKVMITKDFPQLNDPNYVKSVYHPDPNDIQASEADMDMMMSEIRDMNDDIEEERMREEMSMPHHLLDGEEMGDGQ